MTTTHEINFFKKIPGHLIDEIRVTLHGCTFMSVSFEALQAVVGEHNKFQGAGVLLIWFWDPSRAAKKAIRIDFNESLIAHSAPEEWLSISMEQSGNLDLPLSKVNFSLNSTIPGWSALHTIQFFSRISHEVLTEKEDIDSYRHFLSVPNFRKVINFPKVFSALGTQTSPNA